MLSIVVPIYNEQDNIEPLHAKIAAALDEINRPFEVILINDGSKDQSMSRLAEIAKKLE
jgi:glycosyltransferase involved in cell wall biosynthesis